MDLNLKDKVIIVTGGGSGIGEAICISLAFEGAIPFIIDRDKEGAIRVTSKIKDHGGESGYALAELTNNNDCQAALQKVTKEYGKVDGLVNNAGINDEVGLQNGTYHEFINSIKKNVGHYYQMTQLTLAHLIESKGAIVNISSKVAITGQGGTSGYAAANGARNALTREWALELLPHGIRVNSVIVAESYTPLYERWISSFDDAAEKLSKINNRIPLENRMTTPEEIANTVAFLLSDKSSHTTGQLLHVDGGYVHLDRAL